MQGKDNLEICSAVADTLRRSHSILGHSALPERGKGNRADLGTED